MNQQSANLFNLVWLGKGTSWLQVENLVNPFSREYVVTALDSLRDEVYQGLQTLAGGRTISELFEELALPIASGSYLETSYKDMNLDSDREREAAEWIEGLAHDSLLAGQDAEQ